jgi:hypothetical protein
MQNWAAIIITSSSSYICTRHARLSSYLVHGARCCETDGGGTG